MVTEKGTLAFEPPHPGEYIKYDIMPALKMNQSELADRLGVSRQAISNLLNKKTGVSTEMAIRLGQAFRNGARFWLALQLQHDLWREEKNSNVHVDPIVWDDGEAA